MEKACKAFLHEKQQLTFLVQVSAKVSLQNMASFLTKPSQLGTTHYTSTLSIFTTQLSRYLLLESVLTLTPESRPQEAPPVVRLTISHVGENMDETGNAEDRLQDSPVIADMIELTPEGVRDNFPRLQELVSNYIREERLRGVRVRLAYEGDSSLPLTPPHPNNSGLQTSLPPQVSTATNAITLVPTQIPEASTQTLLGLLGEVTTEPPRTEMVPFSIGLSSQSMTLNNPYANPFATYSMPLPHIPANTGYTGDQYFGTTTAQLGVQSMAQQFWQNPYWQAYPYPGYPGYGLAGVPHTQTQSFGTPSFVTPAVTQPIPRPIFHTEDLSQPYVPTTHTKFSARIANFAFPPKTKMPANIKTYDGLGDPDDHLELFSGAATVERWCLPLWCHMFSQTLVGPARLWFNSLPDGSIDTFEDLSRKFLANFVQQKRYTRDPVELHNIKQKGEEDLRAFMERYKLESLSIGGATEQMRVSGFIHGVRPRQLVEDLNRKIPKTMEEAMERTEAFVRGKEAAQIMDAARKPRLPQRKSSPPRSRTPRFTPFDRRSNTRAYDHHRSYSNSRTQEDDKDRGQFTALTKSPKEILATEEARFSFRPPKPLPKSATERNPNRFCDFHGDTGHHTNDCFQLKKRIEAAVKSGELAHLIKDIKSKKGPGEKSETSKEKGKKAEILMVSHSKEEARPNKQAWKPWMRVKIDFPPPPANATQCAPILVNAKVDGQNVHRVYWDGGSAVELMYEHCFRQLESRTQQQLRPHRTSLVGFSGETVTPLGEITVQVTIGAGRFKRTESITFLVVRCPSRYNIIMGRPGISAFGAIVSTAHSMIKFPTKAGICTLVSQAESMLVAKDGRA
ncbi:hypothetical protein E3N88_19899 [Mikania micrantha]|uniref:Retrotransposon gag domain-containing protein n=1 Tax=Mikania micrantha TaxID=192012 RepID=A0A5N6NRF0_9ASTR|nr:hypothetical protein E3N88_19899 [Mikania micrantha]